MGVTKLQNYNKIIDLSFYEAGSAVPTFTIRCPRKGIKPNIQITGNLLGGGQLFNVQIKIRNLYLDLTQSSFTRVKVTAGYESKPVTFSGDIWYMYRENPGPESVTSVMLQTADIATFMRGNVEGSYKKGASIVPLLQAMSDACKYEGAPTVPEWASSLTFPADYGCNDQVNKIISDVKKMFPDYKMDFKFETNGMTIYSTDPKYTPGVEKEINFLSTPPQLISEGDTSGTVATLTAPWDPSLSPGDRITCPATFYVNKLPGISTGDKKVTIQITSLQFQFSTVGSMNSMVIQGVS